MTQKVKKTSVSLYDDDIEHLNYIGEEMGIRKISPTIRYLIRFWLKHYSDNGKDGRGG